MGSPFRTFSRIDKVARFSAAVEPDVAVVGELYLGDDRIQVEVAELDEPIRLGSHLFFARPGHRGHALVALEIAPVSIGGRAEDGAGVRTARSMMCRMVAFLGGMRP